MSRYFNSFMDDYSEALEHSWGTSPEAKAREKEYNHWYYQKHKADIEEVRKRRSAATNYYKQAEKSKDDARRYEALSGTMAARLKGYRISNVYKDADGNYRGKATHAYLEPLDPKAEARLVNARNKYDSLAKQSESRSIVLNRKGDYQMGFAKSEAKRILRAMKNPSAKELVEFYFDTTVEKAKKSASKAAKKAKKYATKAMSTAEKSAKKAKKYATKTVKSAANNAEKYATKAMSSAEKYATKAVSNAEKAANKAKKYVTKTVKSVVR